MLTTGDHFQPVDALIDEALQTWSLNQSVADASADIPVIRTDDDLDAFLQDRLGIVLPNVVVCQHRGHSTPWRAFHEAYFGRTEVAVWKASRGFGGKSFTLGLLAWTEAVTLRADVNVLGGSGEQSARVVEALDTFWSHPAAPRSALASDSTTAPKQRLIWGNVVRALKASQTSVRGPHPQRLRCDEVDEMDVRILKSALGQPMSKGPVLSQVVLSSTHQYPDGTMTDVLTWAVDKGWPVHEWCYRETLEPHGWLTRTEVERKRATMTQLDFDTEVEMQEPNPADLAFNRDAVNASFVPGAFEDGPEPGARYAHGADWGKKTHVCAFASLKLLVDQVALVAFQTMARQGWPVLTATFEAQVQRFGGGEAWHDGTGIGDVIGDYLTIPATGLIMVGMARKQLFEDLIMAIEGGEVLIPDIPETRKLKRVLQLCTRANLFGDDHPPDEIVGLAMAYRAARNYTTPAATFKQPPADQTPHLGGLQGRPGSGGGVFGQRRGLGDLGRKR
jgi:hypothetical protein